MTQTIITYILGAILVAFCMYVIIGLIRILLESWEVHDLIKSGKELRKRILNGEE